jgi:alpha-amylase/alpha-mannosidase (GH57 family)
MTTRYVCIHGHFYQPPRENPWLEDIELQDSAYPFHDWNERVTAECYEPNTASRILDDQERIEAIVNNYARISFNFGPTLLSWLERHRPAVYAAILEADRQSLEHFGGHGAALAQAYNHLIMPLANRRDKRTQVIWGWRDFVKRFGREPEGMWLPETAVDVETLEILAGQGVRFTILAPHQARRIRKIGAESWQPIDGGRIDPKTPYLCRLPSGKSIVLFFYDGPVAREIAFSPLLSSGENFARRLLGTFTDHPSPQLVHVATDGETYGHHHRFGDMALAYGLDRIAAEEGVELTVYGAFLEKHPPLFEVEILENTSWSCAHGVERWRADCGCHIGGEPGWTQKWREPLRAALDWLRDQLAPRCEERLGALFADPWQARDDYIEVILDRREPTVHAFLDRCAGRRLDQAEAVQALHLLELQRQTLLMYTSCGWFFDDLSGIETVQLLRYAGRALQLAVECFNIDLEEDFLALLEKASSNIPKAGNGRRLHQSQVQPVRLDLERVAVHHAIAAEFKEPCGDSSDACQRIYCYTAESRNLHEIPGGRMKLALGRTRIRSQITWAQGEFSFAVLYLGEQNLNAAVRAFQSEEAFDVLCREIYDAFERSDIPAVIRLMDHHFDGHTYNLWHLFKDEQRNVLNQIMSQTFEEIEVAFQQIYENHFPLMRFLQEIGMPIPRALAMPVEMVFNTRLKRLLENGDQDPAHLRAMVEEVKRMELTLDETTLSFVATGKIRRLAEKLSRHPDDAGLLSGLAEFLHLLKSLPLSLDLWQTQNIYFALHRRLAAGHTRAAESGDEAAAAWLADFRRLGDDLNVSVG